MRTDPSPRTIVRFVMHGAAILVAAWSLIATSAPPGWVYCFTDLGEASRVRVVLGPHDPSLATGGNRSCNGIDGVTAGTTLVFDLVRRPPPASGKCFAYETRTVEGAVDVTLESAGQFSPGGGGALAAVAGEFQSSTAPGCRGAWSIHLRPVREPGDRPPVSPLDASPTEPWVVVRQMTIVDAQRCDGAFLDTGTISCGDWFVVEAITEEPAP